MYDITSCESVFGSSALTLTLFNQTFTSSALVRVCAYSANILSTCILDSTDKSPASR